MSGWNNYGDMWLRENPGAPDGYEMSETDPNAAPAPDPAAAQSDATAASAANVAPPPAAPAPERKALRPDVHALRMTETSDGADLTAKEPDADGETSGGPYQIKKATFDNVVSAHPDLLQKYGKFTGLSHEQLKAELDKKENEPVSEDVATALWDDLQKQFSDPRRAYARYNASPKGAKLFDRLEAGEVLHGTDLTTAQRIQKNVNRYESNLELAKKMDGATAANGDAVDAGGTQNARPTAAAPGFIDVNAPVEIPAGPLPIDVNAPVSVGDVPRQMRRGTPAAPRKLDSPNADPTPALGKIGADAATAMLGAPATPPPAAPEAGGPAALGPPDPNAMPPGPPKLAMPPPQGAGAPGTSAPAPIAPPPTPLEQSFDHMQKELETQRAADKTWSADREAHLDQMRADALEGKIDPSRIFAKGGTPMRIMAALAEGLGAAGAGLTHGPNYAHQIIQAAIDSDIEAQKEQLGRKANVYGLALQQYGSERAARQAATAVLWDQARMLLAELRAEGKGAPTIDKKAVLAAQQNAQGGKIIEDVGHAYDQRIGKGTGNAVYAWITKHFPDNPVSEPDSKVYGDTVSAATEMFMKTIPGIRHTPENVERVRGLFPVAGASPARNEARLASLKQSLQDGTLYQHLAESGIEIEPGKAATGNSGDANAGDSFHDEEADTGD